MATGWHVLLFPPALLERALRRMPDGVEGAAARRLLAALHAMAPACFNASGPSGLEGTGLCARSGFAARASLGPTPLVRRSLLGGSLSWCR